LPRSFLMSEDRRSPTRTPRISTRFCLLHVEHNLQQLFLSIVWYHQSSVSVVFLDVCFRQWYHVGYVCIDYQLGLHGQSTVASFVWLLPRNDMSAAAPLLLSCWFCVPSSWFASSFGTCPSWRLLLSAALIVQDSHPYIATDQTKVCMSLHFNCGFKDRSFHKLVSDLAADLAVPSLAVISALQSLVSVMMLPR